MLLPKHWWSERVGEGRKAQVLEERWCPAEERGVWIRTTEQSFKQTDKSQTGNPRQVRQ